MRIVIYLLLNIGIKIKCLIGFDSVLLKLRYEILKLNIIECIANFKCPFSTKRYVDYCKNYN